MAYPVGIEPAGEPRFPKYDLQANPFPVLDEDEGNKLGELGSFWAACAAKEANRLWWETLSRIDREEPISLWLVRDRESAGQSNMGTLVALMKKMTGQERAHLLTLYIPLNLAFENLLKGMARTLADRIVPTDFRKCFYEFAADRVADVASDPTAAEQLSAFDDLRELAGKLRDPKQSGIHRFVFPTTKQHADERHVVRKSQVDETDDAEEAARQLAEREQIMKTWEQRRQLTAFLERRLREGEWGDGVCSAMRRVFETSSFTQARDRLTEAVDHRGSMAGLLKFVRHRFSKTVFVIDQVEAFGAFTDTEKAAFYGSLAEFGPIAGASAASVFVSFPETLDAIGKRRLAAFDILPLELSVTREATATPIPPKAFAELVRQFLASDPLRRESAAQAAKKKSGGLFPFDEKAIEEALSATNGNCLRAAGLLGRLLETTHEAGVKKIDGAFVKTGPSAD